MRLMSHDLTIVCLCVAAVLVMPVMAGCGGGTDESTPAEETAEEAAATTEETASTAAKMAEETETEGQIPEEYRWSDLEDKEGVDQLTFYRQLLIHLGANGSDRVQAIYANAQSALRQPRNLAKLIADIDELDWYSARHEGLGDLYEGLLEKNANEKKSGAGQYFTPRPLINAMVQLVQPQLGERCGDPACGTFGFMIAADQYLKLRTNDYFADDITAELQEFQRKKAFTGIELVPETHRLALMNAMLHGIHQCREAGH